MNRYERLTITLPAFADAMPFTYFLIIMPRWHVSPLIPELCGFAPLAIGIFVLLVLPILRQRNTIPKGSASIPIGITLAIVGIIEPYMFY